uniref:Uncharacterized protein n=1 Tax=Anguilla anguilla TaxID=7936 RepID=A0A0E9RU54_ANGAN
MFFILTHIVQCHHIRSKPYINVINII